MAHVTQRPRVVIVGAGFGGLEAAKALANAPVDVVVIDRQNHHCFQPLLYQVATATLSPGDVAWPIRHMLSAQENATVLMEEVRGIDTAARVVRTDGIDIAYDTLVLATGATHSYFGHEEWSGAAPGLKRIEDATRIRRRLLIAFERAELTENAAERQRLLTFVVVGGGPTGVELAGAIAEVARQTLPPDFRRIDPRAARVLLVEAGPRILPALPEHLSAYATRALARMGVEVRVGAPVTRCDRQGVEIGGRAETAGASKTSGAGATAGGDAGATAGSDTGATAGADAGAIARGEAGAHTIAAATIIWAAGVVASPAGAWLGVPTDRAGRVRVDADLSVPGLPHVFVIGDAAAARGTEDRLVPGLAAAAKQMGRYAGGVIAAKANGKKTPGPFAYRHQGDLATIGRRAAVVNLGRIHLTGFIGWLFWSFAHVYFLIGLRSRFVVAFSWAWQYVTFQRGARLITQADGERDGYASQASP